ncbi:hypothetical protein HPB51_025262 [Rhipicephalus microplus]|uniref:TTF-type domain-containing protein n=1 Tax=Rhipicephalus microplus TaxID=6941 RepID=A0A9J6DKT2_RHIMP|nr:hypothetical protein HPB51_025262 [Rhipicephalus microplus]
MKRHSATTKQRSLASYLKKVRTDEADGEEPPPSKDKTSPSSALVESQARPNFCSDSGECTGLYESPENKHKHDTHAPLGNDGGRSATPSDLCSTVNAGQSDTFTTGQCPRKVSGMAPTHFGSPPLCATSVNIFDLGLFVLKSNNVNDPETMEKLLLNPWTPPADYDYPATGKRNLKFQPQWVDRYPWLVYSKKLQGALCKYCVVFASECAGKGEHQRLGCFVTKEFTNYKKVMDALKSHASSSYHAMSTTISENFLAVRSRSQHDILTQLDHGLKKQAEENRKNLLPIIETILFCGRQEVPLRGTDDSGPINMSEVLPFKNDGNLRALLRMRAKCGDAALRAHMETSLANALYTSPKIQNELITLCGKIIQRKIVENINSALWMVLHTLHTLLRSTLRGSTHGHSVSSEQPLRLPASEASTSKQSSMFPTFSGERATVDEDFEEEEDVSEDGQEWHEGGLLCKKGRLQWRRTPVTESDQPGFEEYGSSSEGGGDERSDEDKSEEDVSVDGASDDYHTSSSSGSSASEENDVDECGRRDVNRLLLESQTFLQEYEDDDKACNVDNQGTNEEDSRANADTDNTFRVFMAAGRVVVLVRPPAAVQLTGRAQLRVLHGILDIEGHVIIGGTAAARVRPDCCLVHSPFPKGFVHVKPLPLEVPRSIGKAMNLRRTLAQLGMDEAWTKLRPLIGRGTAVMLLEKVPGGNWPIGVKRDSQLRGPLQSLGFQLSQYQPSKSWSDPWRQQASALVRNVICAHDFGDHQRTLKPGIGYEQLVRFAAVVGLQKPMHQKSFKPISRKTRDAAMDDVTANLVRLKELAVRELSRDDSAIMYNEGRAVQCVVVCGRQNTGKSSLLRVLVNSYLNFCSEVLYLDCDPGQCEFTPPATVSLTRVTEPLLGPPFTHVRTPEKAYFLGHVSPASQPDSYCMAIRALIDHARKVAPRAPLLVNTMGWVNGKSRFCASSVLCDSKGLGLSLLTDVIRWLCPTDLVQLVTEAENGDTPMPLLDETLLRSACGWMTSRSDSDGLWPLDDLSCYALPGSTFRGRSTARAKREAMVLAYLGRKGSSDGYHLPDTPYWLWNTTPLRSRTNVEARACLGYYTVTWLK